jgi:hypothetical protein
MTHLCTSLAGSVDASGLGSFEVLIAATASDMMEKRGKTKEYWEHSFRERNCRVEESASWQICFYALLPAKCRASDARGSREDSLRDA